MYTGSVNFNTNNLWCIVEYDCYTFDANCYVGVTEVISRVIRLFSPYS